MADSMTQFGLLIREVLGDAVVHLQFKQDDVFWRLMQIFKRMTEAGRDTRSEPGQGDSDWFAEWRIKVQDAGTLEGAKFGVNNMETTGAYGELFVGQAAAALYPDPALAAVESYVWCRMRLKRQMGLIARNKDQLFKDLGARQVGEVAFDAVKDATRLFRNNMVTQAYGDGSAAIARLDGSGVTVTDSAVTWVSVKEGTPYRFTKGQKYVAGTFITAANYDSSPRVARQGNGAGATSPASIMYCVGHRKRTRQVGFKAKAGEGTITLTDGDVLMLYNMYDFSAANVDAGTKAMEGLESLIRDTGKFPGARVLGNDIDVEQVPELQGMVEGDESNREAPTPEIVANLIDLITDGNEEPATTVIAEQSLYTLWSQLEREATAIQIVPQAAAFEANGGVRGPEIQHGAFVFTKLTSSLCREGTLHGVPAEDMRMFMPFGENTIKWLLASGGISGAGDIFGATSSGRQYTGLLQAPFDSFGQIGLERPNRAFRRIGLHSARSQNAA